MHAGQSSIATAFDIEVPAAAEEEEIQAPSSVTWSMSGCVVIVNTKYLLR